MQTELRIQKVHDQHGSVAKPNYIADRRAEMSASGGEGYELFYTNPHSVEDVRRHIARFVTTTDTVGMQAE
jgi:hypothetical protein